ncbi:MAG: carboxypeptidase-like regulatory domain-containing protein [Candidatus Acidiferrales bacterium]
MNRATIKAGGLTCAAIAMAVALVCAAPARAQAPMHGTVVSEHGQPIAGARLYGSRPDAAPYKSDTATTDARGRFILDHPGAVVHIYKESFEPLTIITARAGSQTQFVLLSAKNDLSVPPCGPVPAGSRRLDAGLRLQFIVDPKTVKILGGKADVDYRKFVIKPKSPKDSKAYLALWFGPYAFEAEPFDDDLIQSASFSQRNLVLSAGGTIGIDTVGVKNSLHWRHTGGAGNGADYDLANEDEARLFDEIVSSVCMADANAISNSTR